MSFLSSSYLCNVDTSLAKQILFSPECLVVIYSFFLLFLYKRSWKLNQRKELPAGTSERDMKFERETEISEKYCSQEMLLVAIGFLFYFVHMSIMAMN